MLRFEITTFPEIHTKRLHLRLAQREDAAEILHLRSDRELLRYLDRDPCKDLTEAKEWIQRNQDDFKNNLGLNWVITLQPESKVIGTIGLWRFDLPNHRAEIGYTLKTNYQGKGLMSEAMRAVLEFSFHSLNFHSIEANVNPENEPSKRLLERHGFRQEAYFRENYYYNGHFLDSAIYCLLSPV